MTGVHPESVDQDDVVAFLLVTSRVDDSTETGREVVGCGKYGIDTPVTKAAPEVILAQTPQARGSLSRLAGTTSQVFRAGRVCWR